MFQGFSLCRIKGWENHQFTAMLRSGIMTWYTPVNRLLRTYLAHDHQERNHQGKDNVLLFPLPSLAGEHDGLIQCRERLGGLLKYYEREAA